MSRRDSAHSRSSSGRGARARTDGKVDVSCPQCSAQFRIPADNLSEKLECSECHRVFIPKTTVGKRVKPPDNTKVYVGFGIGAVALIGIFFAMSGGGEKPKKAPVVEAPRGPEYNLGSHPRALQLVQWAQGIDKNDALLVPRYTDLPAAGKQLGVANPNDIEMVTKELQTNISTRFLRELMCESAQLATQADMTAASGTGIVFVTPKPGDDNYLKRTRGEIEVTFRMDAEVVKVTGWKVKLPPIRDPNKADPLAAKTFKPYKDIAKAEHVTISDSAGTRQVMESKPAAVPHWEKATAEQQKLADEVVDSVLKSADPDARGGLLARATMRVRTDDEIRAVVPRLLNAMFENYSDLTANNMRISQLDQALKSITGFAVNYQVQDSADPAKDKAERESCVRQWFAFWYRNSGDISRWRETEETLEAKDDGKTKPAETKPSEKK